MDKVNRYKLNQINFHISWLIGYLEDLESWVRKKEDVSVFFMFKANEELFLRKMAEVKYQDIKKIQDGEYE